AVDQRRPVHGPFAVAAVDGVHDPVELLPGTVGRVEQILLAVAWLRIQRVDLHLETALALPALLQKDPAQRVDAGAVVGRYARAALQTAPAHPRAQPNGKSLRLQLIPAQAPAHLLRHVQIEDAQ